MTKRYIGKQIVLWLARTGEWFSLGDIMEALRLRTGTAAHQRISEQRRQGWRIVCRKDRDAWLYRLDGRQRQRALRLASERAES